MNKVDAKDLVVDLANVDELKYDKSFEDLENKVTAIKEAEKKLDELKREGRECANEFIAKFGDNKPELGKIVSWLGNSYTPEELIAILSTNSGMSDSGKNERFNFIKRSKEVKDRLGNGFNEPEYYLDQRFKNLISVLNTYDNFIETFDSIELENNSNCLDEHRYLISPELHNLLINGYRSVGDRVIRKEDTGIYMVVFKLLSGKSNTLIYKYIKYPYIFKDCFLSYIMNESSSLIVHNKSNMGLDYLFILDKIFGSDEIVKQGFERTVQNFDLNHIHGNTRGIYPRNVIDLYKVLIKGCPVLNGVDGISEFVRLALGKDFYNIGLKLLNLYNLYNNEQAGLEKLKDKLTNPSLKEYNLLSRCVFIVEDRQLLIENLRDYYDVNEGPQKWRGQSDSLSNMISVIDNDFRKSMNRHNQYHVNMGNLTRNNLIGKSKFSYKNIHLNLGNVRWYSTERLNISENIKYYKKPSLKDNSDIYNQLGNYIKESPINEDTQLKIENSLYEHSYISLKDKLNKSNKLVINYNLISSKFAELLMDERIKLIDYINRSRQLLFKKEPKRINDLIEYQLGLIVKELDDDYILSVIYGRLFKIISKYNLSSNNIVIDIFVDIANDLIQNYFYSLYKKNKDELNEEDKVNYKLSDWKKDNKDFINKFEGTKAEIGAKVVNWMKNIDLVWIKLITVGKKERFNVLLPTDRVLKTITNEEKLKPLPRKLPMIVKPRPYYREVVNSKIKERLGGYFLNDDKYTDHLMIPKWRFKESSLIKDDNIIYDLINNISSVGYKVNKDVLDFVTIYGFKYNLLMNTNYDHPLSKKEKQTKVEYIEYSSYLSRLELQENILGVAEVFSNIHEFFIPVRIDFTGRLYCISEYLNYQSTELAKSLLIFSKPEKISKADIRGINYLKAYGANCFGNKLDKKSWKDRIRWVDDNMEKLIKFENGELINQAEKKLLFVAFCFEYKRFLASLNNEKDYFETYLPIQLDATCNGYQHLSLLSLDHNLAKELNLTKSSWNDEPKDFYSFTGVKLISYFKDKLKDNKLTNEEEETCKRLSNLNIARKIVKRAIMTIPYNVSHQKIIQYLQENFVSCDSNEGLMDKWSYFKEDLSIKLKDTDFPILAKGLKVVLGDDAFKLKKLLKYLNEIAKICTELGLFIPWTTPSSGIQVQQSYLALKEERLKAFSYTKKTFSMKVPDKFKYSKTKQVRAFMPNLIHSLDADALALLVDYYFSDTSSNTKNIYTIHDCFAVTANNVENLIGFLKLVYYKIYSENNYLREVDREIRHHIKLHLKDDFDENKLEVIKTERETSGKIRRKILKYPSINDVLGMNSNAEGLILDSAYLVH